MPKIIVPVPRRIDLSMAPSFNATTSEIGFGLAPSQDLIAQTALVYVYAVGSGEGGVASVFQKSGSGSDAPRQSVNIVHNAGSAQVGFAFSCSVPNGQPYLYAPAGDFTYNAHQHFAGTWDGGLLASGIHVYLGTNGAPLTERTGGVSADGTGAVTFPTAGSFHIGNRSGGAYTFNGTIYYVARWNRVLSIDALRQAQMFGPLSVPDGLVLCWANNQDYSPTRLRYTSQTAVVMTGTGPQNTLLQWDWRRPAAWPLINIADGATSVKDLIMMGIIPFAR